jgi:hypothetical protein
MSDYITVDSLLKEVESLKHIIIEKDAIISDLSKTEETLYRQLRRQADNILILCERLRAAGISDKIGPDEKPKLRLALASASASEQGEIQ